MNMNQSGNFRSSNTNFMPMGSLMLPYPPQLTNQDTEESSESQFKRLQKHNLQLFWNQQSYEMQNGSVTKCQNQLPLARIKRIMKSDGDVKMISSETPILFSKACELFIMELTLRSWLQTEGCKRRTLQRNDIAKAIRNDDLLDFLVDVVRLDEDDDDSQKEEEVGKNTTSTSAGNVNQARLDDHESLNHPQMIFGAEMVSPMVQEVPQQFMYDPSMASAFQFKFPPSEQN